VCLLYGHITVCIRYYSLSVSVCLSVFTYCLFFTALWRINVFIIIAYYPAGASSDSVFRALCTNSLTHLLIVDLFGPQKFNFNTLLGERGEAVIIGGGGPTRGIGNFNTVVPCALRNTPDSKAVNCLGL